MTDMNPHASNERPVTDERLSAYFDGEALPDERAEIESLLDDSLAARRELDEISQLSALLHSFPRESAPLELARNVQRQTDQMPLAAQAVAPAAPARSLRREWMAAISGAVVTAAALFVMASVVDQTGSRGLNTVARTGQAPHAAAPAPASVAASNFDGMSDARRRAEGAMDGIETHSLAMEMSPKLAATTAPKAFGGNGNDASDAPTLASSGSETLFEAQQNRALGLNLVSLDNGAVQNFYVNNPDFINGLKRGEVYQFVPQVADNDNNVAVVDLRVLDVERGVGQVQVLLSRNSIQPRLAGQSNDLEQQKAQKLREQSNAGGNEMVVVYTVGPGEQLAKTLEDMQQHPDLFFGWSSQPPVQLLSGDELAASLDDATTTKDAATLVEQPTADKSSTANQNTAKQDTDRQLNVRRKEAASTDGSMDDEAELALNALLVRNNHANNGNLNNGNGLANFNDSNPTNLGMKNTQQGMMARDGKSFRRASPAFNAPAPAGAPSTAAVQPAKALPADPKSAPPSAVRSQTVADEVTKREPASKKSGGSKQDTDVRRELDRQSSYQTTFRVSTDAVPPAEQTPQWTRSSTPGLDNTLNNGRRGSANGKPQQSEGLSRAAANTPYDPNRVKVLFVLHPMPAPAAAPAGKSNP